MTLPDDAVMIGDADCSGALLMLALLALAVLLLRLIWLSL